MIAILKISRRLICLGFVFLSTLLPAQTVDTRCTEFGGVVNCTSTARQPVENGWQKLEKAIDSINESNRHRKEEKERIIQDKERRELYELEMKNIKTETIELNRIARRNGFERENQKNFSKYISQAILNGRCKEANFVSLTRGDIDTAIKIKNICTQKYEINYPIIKPKDQIEKIIVDLERDYILNKESKFAPDAIVLIELEKDLQSAQNGFRLLNFGMANGEPMAFYYSALLRLHKGLLNFDPKNAYVLYRAGVKLDPNPSGQYAMTSMLYGLLTPSEIADADILITSCVSKIVECFLEDKLPHNPIP